MTTLKDANGHAVSGATPAALDRLETALHQFRCLSGDPVASVDAALYASPTWPWATCSGPGSTRPSPAWSCALNGFHSQRGQVRVRPPSQLG